MQLRDRLPIDAVTGACIVTYRSSAEGPFVDLDLDVETLPAYGRICISAEGVELMMTCLGWKRDHGQVEQSEGQLTALRAENRQLRAALRKLIDVAELVELVRAAELASEFPELEPVA